MKRILDSLGESYISILKITAALMVFLHHVRVFTDNSFFTRGLFFFRTCAWAGVWIFFILGGYLSGKSFATGRYPLNKQGILRYYKQRILKTYVPTIAFIFLISLLCFPDFLPNNPSVIFKYIFCTYRGNPGVDGIGATWYVFITMWYYLFVPIVSMILKKMNKGKLAKILLFLIIAGGIFRYVGYKQGLPWNDIIYASLYGNIDLFFSGVIMAFIIYQSPNVIKSEKNKYISTCLLIATILLNSWIMNECEMGKNYWFILQYLFPSIFICVILYFLYSFAKTDLFTENQYLRIKKAIRIISDYTFEFYLFHSIVLNRISGFFHFASLSFNFFSLAFVTFVFTVILSIGFHKIFR